MRGHFDINDTAYPIGPLMVGNGYKVTDMRSLQPLHSEPIPRESASRLASDVNKLVRSGHLGLADGDTSVRDYVEAAVANL